MRAWLATLASLIFFFSVVRIARGDPVNVTIDDQNGDAVSGMGPSYSPAGAWEQGATCTGCLAKPDPSQAFDRTWHDATHTPGDPEPRIANVSFTGTAVYAYCIVPNSIPFTTTLANMTFFIDGNQVGTYVHIPTTDDDYLYDVPVYTTTGLSNSPHVLTIDATGDVNSSLILFDYAVYTADNSTTSSAPTSSPTSSVSTRPSTTTTSPPSSSSSAGSSPSSSAPLDAIIAGVVVGTVFLIILCACIWVCLRRHPSLSPVPFIMRSIRRRRMGTILPSSARDVNPFMTESETSSGSAGALMRSQSQRSQGGAGNTYTSTPFIPLHEREPTSTARSNAASIDGSAIPADSTTLNDTHPSSASTTLPLSTAGSGIPPSTAGSRTPPLSSSSGSSRRPGGKAARRRVELARQVQGIQQTVANLQAQQHEVRQLPLPPDSSVFGSVTTPSIAPSRGASVSGISSSAISSNEEDLRSQIAALQAQVEWLQAQQEEMMRLELNDEAPPEYMEEAEEWPPRPLTQNVLPPSHQPVNRPPLPPIPHQ